MKEFSGLAKRCAGQITLGGIVAAALATGALIYGLHVHNVEVELVERLNSTAIQMAQEGSALQKINTYFDAEASRLEQAHTKNGALLEKAQAIGPWLAATSGSPSAQDLKEEEATSYVAAKIRLSTERADVNLVANALANPQDVDKLKAGLSSDNLSVYSSVKDCALRGAGEGAYCGPAAAVGARLTSAIAAAEQLAAQSEAHARENLGYGWDEWDGAQANLTNAAFAEIDLARKQADESYRNGDLEKDDWDSINQGFDQAKITAADQIKQDRQELQQQVHSGHVSGYNWYLLSRWTASSPVSTVHVVNHPYVAGGSSFMTPNQVGSPQLATGFAPSRPMPIVQVATAASQVPIAGKVASPVGQVPVGGKVSATASGSYAPKIAAPTGANPYSVNSSTSHLGSKVNASFARAAGSRVAALAAQGGSSSRGGLASRVSSISAGRAVASGRSGVSVGHAGVGHAAAGHGGGSGG